MSGELSYSKIPMSWNVLLGDPAVQDDDKPRINKRTRAGANASSTDNSEDSEPDEKRPTFRLQPPTLIHGKAKPVPKPEDSSTGIVIT